MKILKTIFRFILWPLHRGRVLILLPLFSCSPVATQEQSPINFVKVISRSAKDYGEGVNVIVEVKNTSNKDMQYIFAEVTWHDKNGHILESGIGTCKNIPANQTAVIDRYFDYKVNDDTYTVRITDASF